MMCKEMARVAKMTDAIVQRALSGVHKHKDEAQYASEILCSAITTGNFYAAGSSRPRRATRQSARRYLDRAVYISNDHEVLTEAWFWMSQVLDDRD